MKISVVTISFNQAEFLGEAIRSVKEQEGVEVEYIVVDPGSTDGSRDIIERNRDAIAVAVLDPDKGPADGLNKGFAAASGDIFGFINADDKLLPGALKKISDFFSDNPRIDVVCGNGWIIDGDGRPMRRIVPTRFSRRLFVYGAVTFFQQGMFFRSAAFRKTDGFNLENRTCWDGELALDMAMKGCRFGRLFEDIAAFRIHDASISGSGRLSDAYARDLDRLFAKATGRGRVASDLLFAALFRVEKWLTSPRATFARLGTALGASR